MQPCANFYKINKTKKKKTDAHTNVNNLKISEKSNASFHISYVFFLNFRFFFLFRQSKEEKLTTRNENKSKCLDFIAPKKKIKELKGIGTLHSGKI